MIIHHRHFIRFIDGRAGNELVVAFLPGEFGGYLLTLTTEVRIRRDYALKLLKRKTNVEHFPEIQKSIDNGYCILLDQHRLGFLYIREPSKPEIYFLLIKTNKNRSELWLQTFHRIKQSQLNRRMKDGKLLREHADEFME